MLLVTGKTAIFKLFGETKHTRSGKNVHRHKQTKHRHDRGPNGQRLAKEDKCNCQHSNPCLLNSSRGKSNFLSKSFRQCSKTRNPRSKPMTHQWYRQHGQPSGSPPVGWCRAASSRIGIPVQVAAARLNPSAGPGWHAASVSYCSRSRHVWCTTPELSALRGTCVLSPKSAPRRGKMREKGQAIIIKGMSDELVCICSLVLGEHKNIGVARR